MQMVQNLFSMIFSVVGLFVWYWYAKKDWLYMISFGSKMMKCWSYVMTFGLCVMMMCMVLSGLHTILFCMYR